MEPTQGQQIDQLQSTIEQLRAALRRSEYTLADAEAYIARLHKLTQKRAFGGVGSYI